MGKKKKNKGYFKDDYEVKSKKSKKSNRKELEKSLKKAKTVHPTLSKKDAKANRKILEKPLKVDEKFLDRRAKCNHADGTLSVADYRSQYPGKADAYTPMLETMVEVFGEEHVRVCARCFEVMVDRSEVNIDAVKEAYALLYAACGVVTANVRMKGDEVKKVAKVKATLDKFRPVINLLSELDDEQPAANGGSSIENLNDVGMEID